MLETQAVFARFRAYAKDFEDLEPEKIVQYFHTPAALMTPKDVAFMNSSDEIKQVFSKLFQYLKEYSFHHSDLNSAHVKLLSKNQATVSGVATRYQIDGEILEHFGLTYTFRKIDGQWNIITGVLHDSGEFTLSENSQ